MKPIKKFFERLKKWLSKRYDIKFPLPDNRLGKWLAKEGHYAPKYFRESYTELKKVTWPTRSETWRLFLAVVFFSVIMAGFIALADFGFEKLVERLLPS